MASKYKNIVGKPEQLRNCFQNVRIGRVSPDNIPIKMNQKFFALPWATNYQKSCLVVVPLDKPGAIDREDLPLIMQDEDIGFNDFDLHPFVHNIVVTASNDKSVNVWKFGDEGIEKSTSTPEVVIKGNTSRLIHSRFHPLASDVLLTCAGNKEVKLWDFTTQQEKFMLSKVFKGALSTFTWNGDGSLLATESKDKHLRIFDPRSGGDPVGEVQSHESAKGGRAEWMHRLDKIISTGFTRNSTREVSVFDPKNLSAGALYTQKLNASSSFVIPLVDDDTGVVFLAGKGDGNIRMFEVTDAAPFMTELLQFKSNKPQSGIVMYHKTQMDVMGCEVARLLKLTPRNGVIPIRFTIPRMHSDFFQDDLYPETADGNPSMTAEEWFSGESKPTNRVSLEPSDD